jgi:hypothetical protein
VALGRHVRAPRGATTWRGDYQTGNFRQWQKLQAVPGGATIVTSPVHGGKYSARYQVRPGDNPIHSKGERAEARASQQQTGAFEGRERWYAWSTMFPADGGLPPSSGSWNIFTQWHQTRKDGCPPNIAWQADTSHAPPAIKLRVLGGRLRGCAPSRKLELRPAALELGHWYDFVLRVRWSSDPRKGLVQAWIDGTNVVPRTSTATLYRGQGAYLKQGFYRAASPLTTTVYHAGTRAGTGYPTPLRPR